MRDWCSFNALHRQYGSASTRSKRIARVRLCPGCPVPRPPTWTCAEVVRGGDVPLAIPGAFHRGTAGAPARPCGLRNTAALFNNLLLNGPAGHSRGTRGLRGVSMVKCGEGRVGPLPDVKWVPGSQRPTGSASSAQLHHQPQRNVDWGRAAVHSERRWSRTAETEAGMASPG